MGIKSTVYTINPEARKKKYDKYISMMGMAHAKPMIEKARQQGYKVYDGIKIPEKEELKITSDKFKSKNEIIMQILLDWKVLKENLLLLFNENWKDLLFVSEIAGKLERDEYFNDTYRPFNPNDGIFIESPNDPFVKRSFIKGERRVMFKHEIINEWKEDFQNVDNLEKLDQQATISGGDDNVDQRSGEHLYEVFYVQFLGRKIVRQKQSKNKNGAIYNKFIQEDEYEKNKKKIKKDIEKGKYKIVDEIEWLTIYEGARVGSDLYVGMKEKEDNIVYTDENGFEHPEFDYIFGLFNTINGVRVSLQEVILELEKVYNAIRRQLNLEISKVRGDMAIFDEAFLTGKKPASKLIHDLSEHGIATMNSAQEGYARDDGESIVDRVLKSFKLGDHQAISTLLQMSIDIEQTIERITGMLPDRQGTGNASSTATTNQNNVNASVSMTYDMFHFMQSYMNEVISLMLEKVKINWTWLNNTDYGMILSDEQWGYLKATKELSNDSYGAILTDGRLEFDVRRKLEQFFLQEINAQKLRTLDVAKFYTKKSLAASLEVLEKAHEELAKSQKEQEQIKAQSNEKIAAQQMEVQERDREDRQEAKLDEIKTKGEEERKTKVLEAKLENDIIVNEKMRQYLNEQKMKDKEASIKRDELDNKKEIERMKQMNQAQRGSTEK